MSEEILTWITTPKICLFVRIRSILVIIALTVSLTSALSYQPNHFRNPHSFSDRQRSANRLHKNFISDDGLVCACSGKNLFAFQRNGSIAWAVHLNYTCDPNIAPVHGGTTKIFLVAENRVLKIYPLRIGTDEAPVELFFGPGKILGISASLSSSCVLISVQNRGLFAYRFYGQLIWSAGPVLYQHGYRQGCKRNITDCYFTSPPAIDHCESSIFISNSVGELYSLSIDGHHFKWIRDLSSFGNVFIITPGNNGCLYVTIPDRALVVALDVSSGDILWQRSIGPLSSPDSEPVVSSNGWISYSSLDGFLYSISPEGEMDKFPKSGGLSYVVQVNPVLDCSGSAIYISRTEMEGKNSQNIAEYNHISALKPKSVTFTSLVPYSGSVLWSESDPSKFLSHLSQSDLQYFLVDERTLLTFFAVSRNGHRLPCRTARQKLESSCSHVKPKSTNIYTGNKKTIMFFLLIESIVLLLLAAMAQFCCVFWKKKKLRGVDNLGKFLEKRRSLRSQKRALDRMIAEMSQEEQVMEKLGDLVSERESIKRKLSTTYSLGRDGERSLLPLHDEKSRSYSKRLSSDSDEEGKGKDIVEEETSSERVGMKPLFFKHEEVGSDDDDDDDDDDSQGESGSLRRRTVSFNG